MMCIVYLRDCRKSLPVCWLAEWLKKSWWDCSSCPCWYSLFRNCSVKTKKIYRCGCSLQPILFPHCSLRQGIFPVQWPWRHSLRYCCSDAYCSTADWDCALAGCIENTELAMQWSLMDLLIWFRICWWSYFCKYNIRAAEVKDRISLYAAGSKSRWCELYFLSNHVMDRIKKGKFVYRNEDGMEKMHAFYGKNLMANGFLR